MLWFADICTRSKLSFKLEQLNERKTKDNSKLNQKQYFLTNATSLLLLLFSFLFPFPFSSSSSFSFYFSFYWKKTSHLLITKLNSYQFFSFFYFFPHCSISVKEKLVWRSFAITTLPIKGRRPWAVESGIPKSHSALREASKHGYHVNSWVDTYLCRRHWAL